MASAPVLPLSTGSLSLGEFGEPILVDPAPRLLCDVVEAYREENPSLVDPDPSTLGDSAEPTPTELPHLTILARDAAFDASTSSFHLASRLAALVETDVIALRVLDEPQPNAALAGVDGGCVLVEKSFESEHRSGSERRDEDRDAPDRYRIGNDPTLRDRYAPIAAAADEHRLRTPSRRRMYKAFEQRCDEMLARDVIRALDVSTGACDIDATVDGDSFERSDARCLAYAVGTSHGALDHALRRACEDAGLGSRATFTRIKRLLRDAGLVGTESVPQPVGRPRERLVARGALADAPSARGVVEAVQGVIE